jgi:hypothetical protein
MAVRIEDHRHLAPTGGWSNQFTESIATIK